MALYVSTENQKLLWEYTQKIPAFQQYDAKTRETLFKNTMHRFFEQQEGRTLSLADLQQMNRETIATLVNACRQQPTSTSVSPLSKDQGYSYSSLSTSSSSSSSSMSLSPVAGFSTVQEHTPVSKEFFSEQKQGEIQRKFDERQQEYSTMSKKEPPKPIDFREVKEMDKPIENMEELVRIQMMQRQLDVAPAITKTKENITVLQIHENEVLDVSSVNILTVQPTKKVSWTTDQLDEPSVVQELREEITWLKEHLQDLTHKIEGIVEKIKSI